MSTVHTPGVWTKSIPLKARVSPTTEREQCSMFTLCPLFNVHGVKTVEMVNNVHILLAAKLLLLKVYFNLLSNLIRIE